MPGYYMLVDAAFFHERLASALALSWRERSFHPCAELAGKLAPRIRQYAERYWTGDEPALIERAADMPFDRHLWRAVAGEAILFSASEIPELQTAPDALLLLLNPDRVGLVRGPRARWSLVEQAHFGARDIAFGPVYYRPENSGMCAAEDVSRIRVFLAGIDPKAWRPDGLGPLLGVETDEEAREELEWARQCWEGLRDLYVRAQELRCVVVYESL